MGLSVMEKVLQEWMPRAYASYKDGYRDVEMRKGVFKK